MYPKAITRRPARTPSLSRFIALSLVTLAAAGLTGCADQDPTGTDLTTTTEGSGSPAPSFAISDGAHSGNPHFFFLPSLVPDPSPTGTFDPAVAPTVVICALSGSACGSTIATYTTTTGPGGEVVTLQAAQEQYLVNWKTDEFALSDAVNYRIQVLVGQVLLGFADVDIAKHASEFKNPNTGDPIGLINGRTLPIKFRIETGIVGSIAVSPTSADIEVGETQQFQATVLDLHGNPSAEPVTWSSSSAAVASVAPTGLSSGLSGGTTTIKASAQGLSATAPLDVYVASQITWVRNADIYVMSGFGKNPTPLTSTPNVHTPVWSYDHTKLTFAMFGLILDPAANNIWTMNADGSGKTMITGSIDHDAWPRWSPDGSKVAFIRNISSGVNQLMTVTADGATVVQIDPEYASTFDWSPSGTKLVYARVVTGGQPGGEFDIYSANADGTGQSNLSADAISQDYEPDWSPDGSKIVFMRQPYPVGAGGHIYVMNADGSQKTNLTSALGADNSKPRWSPDGSKILFLSDGQLYVMDADGGNMLKLTDTPKTQIFNPDWAPDSRRIVFHQDYLPDGTGEIYVVKADGSKTWRLTNSPDWDHEPAWGP
jgi:Tol biopolymer transport system component